MVGVGVFTFSHSFTFMAMFSSIGVSSCSNPVHPEPLSLVLVCATLGTNVSCQGKGGLNMWTEGKRGRGMGGRMDRGRGIGRAGVCGQGGEVWMGGQVEGLGGNI